MTSVNPAQSITRITDKSIEEYLSVLELKGVTKGHINEVQRYLKNYRKYTFCSRQAKKS